MWPMDARVASRMRRHRRCAGRGELPVVREGLALPQQQSGPVASLFSAHHAEVLTAHIRVLVPVLVVVTVGEHHIKPRETVPLHGLLLTWHPVHKRKIFTRPSLSWYASYESGQESPRPTGLLWGHFSDAKGHRGATGAPHRVLGPSPTCRCGTCCGGSTWPCEAHFLCNEFAGHGGVFFITLRRFWRCKSIHPRRPGKLFHMDLKKKPALMTPHRPISEPNVGPHCQKWHLCPTPSPALLRCAGCRPALSLRQATLRPVLLIMSGSAVRRANRERHGPRRLDPPPPHRPLAATATAVVAHR